MAKPTAPKSFTEALDRAKLSDIELAFKIGVTTQTVRNWREKTNSPGGPTRLLLASMLGYPLAVVEAWFA